jgi:hypothetical protein
LRNASDQHPPESLYFGVREYRTCRPSRQCYRVTPEDMKRQCRLGVVCNERPDNVPEMTVCALHNQWHRRSWQRQGEGLWWTSKTVRSSGYIYPLLPHYPATRTLAVTAAFHHNTLQLALLRRSNTFSRRMRYASYSLFFVHTSASLSRTFHRIVSLHTG